MLNDIVNELRSDPDIIAKWGMVKSTATPLSVTRALIKWSVTGFVVQCGFYALKQKLKS